MPSQFCNSPNGISEMTTYDLQSLPYPRGEKDEQNLHSYICSDV
jgi:hypothetical protein